MIKKILFLLLLISQVSWAQTADELFTNANTLYKDGKYTDAIELYQQIEATGKVSSELYYNLGNCYYKLNQVAPTIYNYEKALKINPLNEDAQNNLIFAKRLTLDRIEALPKSVYQKFNESFLQKLTYNQWAWVAVLLSIVASVLFLLFYFAQIPNKRRLFFILSMVSFLLLIFTLVITFNQYNYTKNNIEAIIFPEKVEIKDAPTNNANHVFTLHEGTKVNVLDEVDSWKKIKLLDGKIGWTNSKNLKEI